MMQDARSTINQVIQLGDSYKIHSSLQRPIQSLFQAGEMNHSMLHVPVDCSAVVHCNIQEAWLLSTYCQ